MSTRDKGLLDRDRLATELVEHLVQDGGAERAVLPISRVDAAGRLSLWKVTVERVPKLDFGAG